MGLEVKQILGVTLQISALPNITVDLGGFTALLNTGQLFGAAFYLLWLAWVLVSCLGGASTQILVLEAPRCAKAVRMECGTSCKADVHGGCKGFPRKCSSCSRGVWSAEGCLPPCWNYKDEGLCWKFRGHLAHSCHRHNPREDMVTHEPEVGVVKWPGVLSMDLTREKHVM